MQHSSVPHFALAQSAAATLEQKWGDPPAVAWVLGSGLSRLGNCLEDSQALPYGEIPGMQSPSIAGHSGQLLFGSHAGNEIAILSGRTHLYEGHSVAAVVHGVRTLALWGVKQVILTNAAGGIGSATQASSLMVIDDHLNLTGHNPLLGPNDHSLGPRFVDMTCAYDRDIFTSLVGAGDHVNAKVFSGIYAGLLGPNYETPAEIQMLKHMGAQAVGMSTVLETLALRHLEVKVGAISCITNLAASRDNPPLDHKDVQVTASQLEDDLTAILLRATAELSGAD